jgi:hypothetical protein
MFQHCGGSTGHTPVVPVSTEDPHFHQKFILIMTMRFFCVQGLSCVCEFDSLHAFKLWTPSTIYEIPEPSIYASGYIDNLFRSWGEKNRRVLLSLVPKQLKYTVNPQKALSSIPKLSIEGNALSISPFLVLDDNTDICKKNSTLHLWAWKFRETPPRCVHDLSSFMEYNSHISRNKKAQNVKIIPLQTQSWWNNIDNYR